MARIKPKGRDVVYHCMSRIVGGQFLLKDREKEKFRDSMWAQAEFCGVQIVSYCVMSNHFHILVKVRGEGVLDDREILRRVDKFYGSRHEATIRLSTILSNEGAIPEELRNQYLARMNDVSIFMKELKQRFSGWYNRLHDRFGTLWAERFRSTLIEGVAETMLVVSAYIDLNPVRAGIIQDPKDYRFCGYAEAVAGGQRSRAGIMDLFQNNVWRSVLVSYRKYLLIRGGNPGGAEKIAIDRHSIRLEIEKGAEVSVAQLLRLKIRYFTDGVALGSANYVDEVFWSYRDRFGMGREDGARPLNSVLKSLSLTSIRDLRKIPYS